MRDAQKRAERVRELLAVLSSPVTRTPAAQARWDAWKAVYA